MLKVGQFLSCRSDLLPRAWLDELVLLQDRVPPEELDTIVALLEAELDMALAEALPGFDPTPIAAASLAQVHVAEHDGRPVAVKVQRPGIATILASDRRAMNLVAQVLGEALPFDTKTVTKRGAGSCRWKGHDVMCGPEGLAPEHDRLYRGLGDGRFEFGTGRGSSSTEVYGFGIESMDKTREPAPGEGDLFMRMRPVELLEVLREDEDAGAVE